MLSMVSPRISVYPALLACLGGLILCVNVSGFLIPLRAESINGYSDFAGGETRTFDESIGSLDGLAARAQSKREIVTAATRIFHEGIAHVSPGDVEMHGVDYYRMRVPVSENWVLYILSHLKPDTYRDYEFCSYRRALRRGTGRCGQQALALVSFLSSQGIETGFVALGGHAIATAKVDDSSWFLLDPDYGGVIPYSIELAERAPSGVLQHYWSDAATINRIDHAYAPDNRVSYGGPEARFGRACPIESAAYVIKWAFPAVLLIPLLLSFRTGSRNR